MAVVLPVAGPLLEVELVGSGIVIKGRDRLRIRSSFDSDRLGIRRRVMLNRHKRSAASSTDGFMSAT